MESKGRMTTTSVVATPFRNILRGGAANVCDVARAALIVALQDGLLAMLNRIESKFSSNGSV
jgi:hypothetical protein